MHRFRVGRLMGVYDPFADPPLSGVADSPPYKPEVRVPLPAALAPLRSPPLLRGLALLRRGLPLRRLALLGRFGLLRLRRLPLRGRALLGGGLRGEGADRGEAGHVD